MSLFSAESANIGFLMSELPAESPALSELGAGWERDYALPSASLTGQSNCASCACTAAPRDTSPVYTLINSPPLYRPADSVRRAFLLLVTRAAPGVPICLAFYVPTNPMGMTSLILHAHG